MTFTGAVRVLARVALAVAVVVALAGCYDTGAAVCNVRFPQIIEAERIGYRYDCTPPAYFEEHGGWADHKTRTLWIWADRGYTERTIRKIMWHELGHAHVRVRGMTFPTQAAEERWVDGWAWCREPIQGVSYLLIPSSCAGYR